MSYRSSKMAIDCLMWPLLIYCLGLMQANASASSNLQKLKKGIYAENLAPYRIEFCKRPKAVKKEPPVPFTVPLDQAQHLEALLAKRKVAYERIDCLRGYTIQVYMGGSRAAALKAQDLASTATYLPELHYRQPHYTVRLGFFSDRLEAYFVYLALVKKITSCYDSPLYAH